MLKLVKKIVHYGKKLSLPKKVSVTALAVLGLVTLLTLNNLSKQQIVRSRATATNLQIFSGALTPGWMAKNVYGGTADLSVVNQAPVYDSSSSISFRAESSEDQLNIYTTLPIDPSKYNQISFAAQPASSGQNYDLKLLDINQKQIGNEVHMTQSGASPQAGVWGVYNIPLSAFGARTSNIAGFGMEAGTGTAQKILYVDDIKLIAAAEPSPTSIYILTPTIHCLGSCPTLVPTSPSIAVQHYLSPTVKLSVTPGASGLSVSKFVLVNGKTGFALIDPLAEGTVVNLAVLAITCLDIEAVTSPVKVGSVKFTFDTSYNNTETDTRNFVQDSDSGGPVCFTPLKTGSHTIKATPYSGTTAGTSLEVHFTIVNQTPTPTPTSTVVPTATAEPTPTPSFTPAPTEVITNTPTSMPTVTSVPTPTPTPAPDNSSFMDQIIKLLSGILDALLGLLKLAPTATPGISPTVTPVISMAVTATVTPTGGNILTPTATPVVTGVNTPTPTSSVVNTPNCAAAGGTCKTAWTCDWNTQVDNGQMDCSTDFTNTCCVLKPTPTPSPTPVPCASIPGTCQTGFCDWNTQVDNGQMDCSTDWSKRCCSVKPTPTPTPITCWSLGGICQTPGNCSGAMQSDKGTLDCWNGNSCCVTVPTPTPTPIPCSSVGGTCQTTFCDWNTQVDNGQMNCSTDFSQRCCTLRPTPTPTPTPIPCSSVGGTCQTTFCDWNTQVDNGQMNCSTDFSQRCCSVKPTPTPSPIPCWSVGGQCMTTGTCTDTTKTDKGTMDCWSGTSCCAPQPTAVPTPTNNPNATNTPTPAVNLSPTSNYSCAQVGGTCMNAGSCPGTSTDVGQLDCSSQICCVPFSLTPTENPSSGNPVLDLLKKFLDFLFSLFSLGQNGSTPTPTPTP